MNLFLENEEQTKLLGKNIANCCDKKLVIYLDGLLGTGKTTFARGFIQNFGFDKVKSPTYAIVESYVKKDINIHHFDLYRLAEAEELEMLGIRDYEQNSILLVEWADKGDGFTPKSDLIIKLTQKDNGRYVQIITKTDAGNKIIKCLEENF